MSNQESSNETKNFYVTSPIYYVNDVPHIGHGYTSIACDIIANSKRMEGYNVFFLTGTDEHGQKVEKSAIKANKTPQEFCNEISQKFFDLTKTLKLSNNDFIRTTESRHKKVAQNFWSIIEKNGWIYKSTYQGWYAVRDEAFYNEDELIDGKAPTGAEVEWHKEDSYFFKLSAFQDKLLAIYEAVPDFICPASKRNEVVSFVKSGLKDLSISRTSFSWGIKIPKEDGFDENHIMYVWLDALTNYISALNFNQENSSLFNDFWCNTVDSPLHIVGKDILRFHCVYWPAFLMAADLPLPNKIFAHGWWTNSGQKISKSLGNVINIDTELSWIESCGCSRDVAVDYFRYFLFREVPFGNDGDYSRSQLLVRINAELANNIGNLAQRSLTMINKNNHSLIVDIANFEDGKYLLDKIYQLKESIIKGIDNFAFDQAINQVVSLASECNIFIDRKAPWKLKKEQKIEEMNLVLSTIAECLRCLAIAIKPFIPYLANQILDILAISAQNRNFLNIDNQYCLKKNQQINEMKIIFPRLQLQNNS